MSKTAQKTINEKIQELQKELDWFYSEEFTLDQAEKSYKSAIDLANSIESDLKTLKNRIEVISKDFSTDQ